MRKPGLLIFVVLAAASVAMAQVIQTGGSPITPPTGWAGGGGDVLGAHLGYGRGCVMCHAPHGGVQGNGGPTTDSYNGRPALWGQNLSIYEGDTFNFVSGSFPVVLPSTGAGVSGSDTNSGVLLCLSCHDGNVARVSMMQNQTVESLPIVGGHAPTLFGLTPGNSGFNYYNEHPVGPNAVVGCTASGTANLPVVGWSDCEGGGQTLQPIAMNGTASGKFVTNNPSSFWNGLTYTGCTLNCTGTGCCPTGNTWGYTVSRNYPLSTPTGGTTVNAVTCTTCHNQHSMTVWTVNSINYSTMFFIRGFYNPTTGGNNVAQFCRNCHGGWSNEEAGLMSVTTN